MAIEKTNVSGGWLLRRAIRSIAFGLLFIVLILVALTVSVKCCDTPAAKDYSIYWPKDLSYAAADSIALALVSQMSLDEKLDQMSGDASWIGFLRSGVSIALFKKFPPFHAGENERLHIPPFTFSDGPRGVTIASATTFPVAMARGATWDKTLEQRVGNVIGTEVRAAGANYFGGVCINLLRHPAWGRAQETFGEDPWHVGQMGVSLVKGVQKHNVMACAKHFALNSIEDSRFHVNVTADERTLREVYLPHFEMVVKEGNVASVMSAYNKVRGEYCSENEYLLNAVLRDDWLFKGFVSSDWLWGLHDEGKGILAGLDVEMPLQQRYSRKNIQKLLDIKTISIAQIDDIVRRVVRTKLLYITKTDQQAYPETLLANEAHQQLALEVAEKSMVLLKNKNNLLPLAADQIKTLAVIGALAKEENTGDKGSSHTNPPHAITILEGLQQFSNGAFKVNYHDGRDLDAAGEIAANADAVLYVMGYEADDEGEYTTPWIKKKGEKKWGQGGDRPDMFLKPEEQNLLKELLPVNANSIVVLIGGSGIMTNKWDTHATSIVMAWYPGMMGGQALANILFGAVNPSGRLPLTIPAREQDLPYFKADIDSIHYGYYHGYTLLDKSNLQAAYPFGFGLSYTTFTYSNIRMDNDHIDITDTLHVSVDVTNTGHVAGEEVVQLYIGFEHSAVDRPVKLLRGFDKTVIQPAETKTIKIPVAARDLAWYDPDSRQWVVEPMEYEVYMSSSAAASDALKSTFVVSP